MQAMRVLALALLALGASATRRSATSASLSEARVWLKSHGPVPNKDELQDLRNENPEAYAIVKALLTKRSLGLLDPKHPTASFAPNAQAAPAAAAADVPKMSSVDFAASMGVGSKAAAATQDVSSDSDSSDDYVPPPVHHAHKDWLNWRPADSASDDEAQVQSVLGAVSQLRAGGAAPAAPGAPAVEPLVDSTPAIAVRPPPLAQPAPVAQLAAVAPPAPVEEPSMQPVMAVHPPPIAAQPVPVVAAVAKPAEDNSYLRGIDFGASARQAAAEEPQKAQDNSYLKGLDLGAPQAAAPIKEGLVGVRQAVSQVDTHRDYLKEFQFSEDGFGSDQPSDDHPLPAAHIVTQDQALPAARILTPFGDQSAEVQPVVQEAQPTAAPKKQNALVSWLGSSWGPMKAEPTAKKSAELQSSSRGAGHYSSYLKGLVSQ